jgi:uncharacterized protein (DUF427 family)
MSTLGNNIDGSGIVGDMTLTLLDGPLGSNAPDSVNYEIVGPQHKLLLSPFPRRLRAVVGDSTLVDTRNAMLLHESNILPVAYIPLDGVDMTLLRATDQSTHCPFKGDASYWSIVAGDRTEENAVWGYLNPHEDAKWLDGYVAMYWDSIDAWFDEDEQVHGHLRDPYHRVDIRPTSSKVTVTVGGVVVAESSSTMLLSETGFPNRHYIPAADISRDLFTKSETTTHCPYKGDTEYWSLVGGAADVAWSYPAPLVESTRVGAHWSFLGDDVEVTITDG